MNPKTRFSVVGAGRMGRRHAAAIAALDGAELASVFDTDRPAAAAIAAELGTCAAESEEEAIALAEIVIVATPIRTHGAITRRALDLGRIVLVEKPLVTTAKEAHDLTETGKK